MNWMTIWKKSLRRHWRLLIGKYWDCVLPLSGNNNTLENRALQKKSWICIPTSLRPWQKGSNVQSGDWSQYVIGFCGETTVMSRLFERLQQQLYTESSAYWDFIYDVAISQKDLQGLELVHSYCILRLGMALQHWQETGLGASDVIVLLRQVIRSYERRLEIPRTMWQRLSTYSYQSGLLSIDAEDTTRVQVVADDWCPYWLSGTKAIDRLQRRRNDQPAPGDGLLYAMTDGRF